MPNADYLAIGHWLYVPEDVTDSVNYEFGVFASGGDPFEVSYLAPLAGTATYLGDALGMYYVDGLSDDPIIGSFTADVTLEADFGDGSETGFISGEVNRLRVRTRRGLVAAGDVDLDIEPLRAIVFGGLWCSSGFDQHLRHRLGPTAMPPLVPEGMPLPGVTANAEGDRLAWRMARRVLRQRPRDDGHPAFLRGASDIRRRHLQRVHI